MCTHIPSQALRLGVVAAAAWAALLGPTLALAEDDELAALLRPDSQVRLGVGTLGADSPRLGLYGGGPRDKGTYGLADGSLVRRDDATGTWTRVTLRGLGLDSPDLRAEFERQGQWNLGLEFSRLTRHDPLQISTTATGIGSSVFVPKGGATQVVQLASERDRISMVMGKVLAKGLDVQLRYRTEARDGARLWGRGTGEFLAEPLGSRSHELEATLGWVDERLQLQAGYLGSAFLNRWAALDVATGTDIALPPDNQAHQFFITGGYSLAPTTRATFKWARTHGIQNDGFYTAPDFPGNRQTSLNGRVDTTFSQFGLTARPWPVLGLLLNLRYEDREDKTPRVQFMPATTGRDGFNTPFSRTTFNGKVEATLQLPAAMRLIGGVERDERKRSVLSIRQASWRERNDETTWRLELRRNLGESLNGSLAVLRARRGGSDYLAANNNAAADLIDPLHFADRDRDKVRLMLDWAVTSALSLQLTTDESRDIYDGRLLGPESGRARLASLDANWTLSDAWQLTGWVTRDDTRMHQSTLTGANGTQVLAQTWQARLSNRGDAVGLGVRGRPTERLEAGADLQWARDINRYGIVATLPAAALLPDVATRRQTFKLFAQWELSKTLGLRVDLGHDRMHTNDWTWTGWVYADGTTVLLPPRQRSSYGMVSVQMRL